MIFSAERIYDLIRFIIFFVFELLFHFLSGLKGKKAGVQHILRGKPKKPIFIETFIIEG